MAIDYDVFEVRIQADPGDTPNGFKAEVLRSSFGRDDSPFRLPFPATKLEKMPATFDEMRSGQSAAQTWTQEIGQKLFGSLFAAGVGKLFDKSLAPLETQRDRGLRILLNFDLREPRLVPVAALPWELLFNRDRGDFLSRIRQTPIARFLEVKDRPPLPRFAGPLRILVVQSSPTDLPHLDLASEWKTIWRTFESRPDVEVSSLLHPSVAALRDKLLEETWHVLHFMGHGGFNEESGVGHLCFEGPGRQAERISGTMLGEHLKSCPDLRLVFLNACKTAKVPRRNGQDPYSGTATALVQAGVPAVIAMQAPIYDDAALAFSAHFYARIAAREPVDAATVEGRLAILREEGFDWATPVLFTRIADGNLLGEAERRERSEPETPTERRPAPLRLGIRCFSDAGGTIAFGEEMERECEDILDLRPLFGGPNGRYPKDQAAWQDEIVPRLRDFLAQAASSRRPLHLNFAAHASIAFAAGYFLEAKSGLDITLRQRGKNGVVEWRAAAGPSAEGTLFLPQKDVRGAAKAQDVAVALAATRPVLDDVKLYLKTSGLAVRRILPATLAPAPSANAIQDALHALQIAEVLDARLRDRTVQERLGTLHLFAAAPNALLFFLGQLAHGLGRIQLYEYDFHTGAPGAYTPSILLPPADEGAV